MAFGYQQAADAAMLDELTCALREFFTSEEIKHMGQHALMRFIQESLPQLWHWARDHSDDIIDAISAWPC